MMIGLLLEHKSIRAAGYAALLLCVINAIVIDKEFLAD